MLEDLDQVLTWLLAVLIRPTSGLYGELDLQDGDRDPLPGVVARYGGQDRPDVASATHVRDLHRDLRELGILLAPADDTTFTRRTRWAVQEFQRYASLPDSATQRLPDSATLIEAATAASGTIKAGPATAFPPPPFRVRVDAEVLDVTGIAAAGELTVTRGAEDTVAAAHASGVQVDLVRWSDRLVAVPAHFYERYTEAITGVVNPWTRFVLRRWKDQRRRCPIVVEAWQMKQGQPDRIHPSGDNVWGHKDVPSNAPRFYVRDLTRTWQRQNRPPAAPAHPELDVTGDWARYLEVWGGPRATPNAGHTWRPEAEMLPEHLLPGGPFAPSLQRLMDAGDRGSLSTYLVVRAVAEVEAYGYFDVLNAFDRAFISLGPCHWTAGPASDPLDGSPVADGELWAFLSYLKAVDRDAFDQAVGRFGIGVAGEWGENGRDLFYANQRKYVSRPTVAQEDGSMRVLRQVVGEFDAFRSWHWFYRFQMAARTVEGFRRRMWHMARLRIRDIGETPWDGPADQPTWTVPDPQGARPARIKDVITSERGMALVYRWHISAPANIVAGGPASEPQPTRRIGRAGPVLRAIYDNAAKENATLFAGAPDTWTDAAEEALIAHLLTHPGQGQGLIDTLRYVHDWPRWGANPRGYTLPATILPEAADGQGRRLSTARHSFAFDAADLPLPPL
ncbi:peptidoglycan-binding protein [Nonomuraea sp. NPDC050556]|uniref:peptidoglycan-binding protein n=1 Tax=Nonomuraea sp. NPDC050556 TaxID=3364369 RepID=UPI0037ABE205